MYKEYILDENTNVCDIKDCIKKIKGLQSNSASPTDSWIVDFKENTYYQSDKIYSGFLKIFINPESAKKFKYEYKNLLSLDYELRVYKDIIRPLVDLNICTNFVKYLAGGSNCTYNNLFEMLNDHIYTNKNLIDTVQIFQSVLRNTVEGCTEEHLLCVVLEKPISTEVKNDITYLKNGFHLHFPNCFLNKVDLEVHILPRIKNSLSELKTFENLALGSC